MADFMPDFFFPLNARHAGRAPEERDGNAFMSNPFYTVTLLLKYTVKA